jgi:hypothetical protein
MFDQLSAIDQMPNSNPSQRRIWNIDDTRTTTCKNEAPKNGGAGEAVCVRGEFTDKWETYGNVFNSHYYDKKFTDRYWSWSNDVIKNGSCIIAANRMFNIGYQFNMIPFLRNESGHVPDLGNLIEEWHDTYFDALPKIDTFPMHLNTQFNGNLNDGHPDIRMSLIFFNNYIRDRFKFTLDKNQPQLLKLYNTLSSKLNMNMKYDDSQKLIIEEVQTFDPTWNFDKEGW